MNNDLINLIELNELLNSKYKLDTKIITLKKINNNTIKNKFNIHIDIIKFILTIIFIIILYVSLKKYIDKKYLIIFNIFIVLIILYKIYYIFDKLTNIYFYYKKELYNEYKYNNNNIKIFKDIDFDLLKTGDILQNANYDQYRYSLTYHIFNFKWMHTLFLIKYKNSIFTLHYTSNNYYLNLNYIQFNKNKHIEILPLKEFLYNHYYFSNKHRLFKASNNINIDTVFYTLKKFNSNDISFNNKNLILYTNNNLNKNYIYKKFNCLSFILYLLKELNVIYHYNYHIFLPNDLVLLPELSNNFYSIEYIFKIMK